MAHELVVPVRSGYLPAGPVVADTMIRFPKVCGTELTVGQARDQFLNDHVHALLVVGHDDRLVAVVEREDLPDTGADALAWTLGRLAERVVHESDDLVVTTRRMADLGRRRFAVVADGGRLVGLLCRKRSGRGFCSDDGVAARAAAASRTSDERTAGP